MTIYLMYDCYFRDDGSFRKVLRKLFDSKEKADEYYDNYEITLLQWLEVEERNLE